VLDELVTRSVELPRGELQVLQPKLAAELPDLEGVDWAPVTPYWSVLWRSGVALASALEAKELDGVRVVELGCGLAVPSLAAARAGADVLATDGSTDALELVARNAQVNQLRLETATVDWAAHGELTGSLTGRAPFDLVVASDVLYERASVGLLLRLLPQLAREAWVADPGRSAADAFVEEAARRWHVDTTERDNVKIHRIQLSI
jgi:predicted nicotinamide N-methyase